LTYSINSLSIRYSFVVPLANFVILNQLCTHGSRYGISLPSRTSLQNATNKYIKCECHFELKFPHQLFEGFLQIFKSIHAQCSPSFTPNWPLICFFIPTLMLSIESRKIITKHKIQHVIFVNEPSTVIFQLWVVQLKSMLHENFKL
jgi:hypothetical protein